MTINLHNCRILLALTPEQFERFIDASRDGAAIETTGEPVPPSEPPPAAASNVIPFPFQQAVGA